MYSIVLFSLSLYRAFARPMLLVSEYIAPHPAVFWNRSPARSVPSLGISSCIRVALLTLVRHAFEYLYRMSQL